MSEGPNPELDLDFFHRSGFESRKCLSCGGYFWTKSRERTTCGDPACDSYTFIGTSTTDRPYSMDEMRSAFIDFFRQSHGLVKPYPVVPRWRDDVLLVNASIYDFQPHVTSGRVKPPSNPLVMSQPSIRMNDIDLVGNTGRHLSSFEMMCHDAFNSSREQVYWKEETVSYCFEFLTSRLNIDPELITFKEKPWSGGGNGGNAFEVFIKGVEVATLVFMDMIEDENGEFEIDGRKYTKMPLRIVDTGYGLERLVWLSQGSSTIYQAVFPEVLSKLTEIAGIDLDNTLLRRVSEISATLEPFSESKLIRILQMEFPENKDEIADRYSLYRDIFALCDHTKTITILLSNYVIPSNVKVGYLLRLLIRRSQYLMERLRINSGIIDLIKLHKKYMGDVIPDLDMEFIQKILALEDEKYRDLMVRGRNTIIRLFDRKKGITEEDFVSLYDSEGLNPEIVARVIREERNFTVQVPENIRSLVVSKHENQGRKKGGKVKEEYPDLYTRPLYYDDTAISEFNAVVLFSRGRDIITNQTAFYPEGGGQPSDTGEFIYRGKKVDMLKAEKSGRSVVHHLSGEIPESSRIIGRIDYDKRFRHMVHHSATHLLLGTLIKELGPHVWQTGVQKGYESSRIDFTHFEKLTDEQIERIERSVFRAITEGHRITVRNIEWNKALGLYGFRLFEGGVPEDEKIRVVEIADIDAEGCGGTHLKNTSEIGFFKILKVESIQEGIQRITFCAGPAAFDYVKGLKSQVDSVSSILRISSAKIGESVQKMLDENMEMRSEIQEMIRRESESLLSSSEKVKIGEEYYLIVEVPDQRIEDFLGKYILSLNRDGAFLINGSTSIVGIYSPGGKAEDTLIKIQNVLNNSEIKTSSRKVVRLMLKDRRDAKLIKGILVDAGSQGRN